MKPFDIRLCLPYLMAALLMFLSVTLAQQPASGLDEGLKIDAKIAYGKFQNGLTYYIRVNKKPEKRAELRLVVKAGSVLEDDDQQGLAHLAEHMAFNGTKSFPKQDIVNFLERSGVRFGPDLNAYTSFDETVYIIQVPTDSPRVVQQAFQILEEWAHAVTFDEKEIDKERGVVIEEWRLGKGAQERVRNKHIPFLFHDSKYAKRLPIGKKEILESCSYETLRRFYRDWYRPDLMAVVAVGDFEQPQIQSLIEKHFSGLKNPSFERERTKYKLPDHPQTLVSVATDAELPFSSVTMFFKRPAKDEVTVNDYRDDLLSATYDGMLNARLQERLQQPNPPFMFAFTGDSRFVGEKQAYQLFAGVKENSVLQGLEALVTEAFRVQQFGFTASELDRQKKEKLRFIESAYKERDKTESRSLAEEFIRNFLQKEPIPGIETEFQLYNKLIPGITLEEVNGLTALRITPGNRVVTVSAPKKENVSVPSDAEVLTMIGKTATKRLEPYVDKVSNEPLVNAMPKAGTVTGERTMSSLGVTEWKLSNGALVVLKPTDFKNDEILFSAYSRGGTSLAPDQDFVSASWSAAFVNFGGVGNFDAIALQKMLTGKMVGVNPSVSELSEGFNGSASPQDLETLFQLVYLYVTAPRYDTTAFYAFMVRQKAFLQNRSVSPENALTDTVQVTMAQYHVRARPLTVSLLDEIKPEKAFAFYKDRFGDISDFVFFFVGNFQPDKIKPLVQQYLASLPSLNRKESWRDVGIKPPKGVINKQVLRGIEPKSQVQLNVTGPFDWSRQSRYDLQSTIEVLRIKLREVLREDKGGVYGVGVSASPQLFPRKEYRISIGFGCSPDRVDELVSATIQQIDSLKIKRPDEVYVEKTKELQRGEREVSLKENRFWLSQLRNYYANGENPEDLVDYPKLIDGLTGEAIQQAARKYFDMSNCVKVVLNPEKK